MIGIDHAGHTFHANHTEIERKIKETNAILKDVIKKFDEDTVLLLYGDHGMTSDGNHGGDSEEEVRTVFFAYSKGGFPLLSDQKAMSVFEEFKAFDDMTLQDVAPTAADILGLPTPFSSLGILNPILHTGSIMEMPARMYENLAQIERFVHEYCSTEAGISWCEPQLEDIQIHMAGFEKRSVETLAGSTEDIVRLTLEMRSFAKEKYQVFREIWMQYDTFIILCAISLAFWLTVHFLLYGVLASNPKSDFSPPTPFFIAVLYGIYNLGVERMYFSKLCILVVLVICFFSIDISLTVAVRHMRLEQNIFGLLTVLVFAVMLFSEALRTEGDSVTDSLVLFVLALTYFAKRKKSEEVLLEEQSTEDEEPILSKSKLQPIKFLKSALPYAVIVLSVKMAYFFDKGTSLNFRPHPTLQDARDFIQGNRTLGYGLSILGFAGLECIEVWVARKWQFNRTLGFCLSQVLTVALIISN